MADDAAADRSEDAMVASVMAGHAAGLRRSRWPGSPTRMNKISYTGYRFPPEIIHQAIWLYLKVDHSAVDRDANYV